MSPAEHATHLLVTAKGFIGAKMELVTEEREHLASLRRKGFSGRGMEVEAATGSWRIDQSGQWQTGVISATPTKAGGACTASVEKGVLRIEDASGTTELPWRTKADLQRVVEVGEEGDPMLRMIYRSSTSNPRFELVTTPELPHRELVSAMATQATVAAEDDLVSILSAVVPAVRS